MACRGIGTQVVTVSQAWDGIPWKSRTRESRSNREAENKKEFDIPEGNYVFIMEPTAEMAVKKREIKF